VDTITVIASNYPSPGREVNVFVQQLVHALIDQDIKVTVLAYQSVMHSLLHKVKLLPRHSLGVTDTGIEYDIYRPYTISFGNSNLLSGLTKWVNKKSITSLVNRINSDVLYCHFWTSALPVYKYALKNHIPLFVACGEGDNALEDMVASMSKTELKDLTSAITGVVSVSSENKRKCIEYGLAKENEIEVFPNCVDTNLFKQLDKSSCRSQLNISQDDFVIAFVGGFIPRKGPERVAQAIECINDSSIKVMFIGKEFPGYPFEFDCSGIIHKGPVDHNKLPTYLNAADIFVLPTQKEGCCNAVVEALSVGLPIVSSNGAFNDDILDNKNSIRIDPNDVNAIVKAIITLRDDKKRRSTMADYSHSRHDEYSIKNRARGILSFINNQLVDFRK